MLYTRKGDSGLTILFGKGNKVPKSSPIIETLGTLDEVSSFLGLCKVKSENLFVTSEISYEKMIHTIQNNLAIIESEISGSSKKLAEEKINELEFIIAKIEEEIPPLKNFCLPGGTEVAALFDIARTLTRNAERRVVILEENKILEINSNTKKYLNRLSSLLFAIARLTNYRQGAKEAHPEY